MLKESLRLPSAVLFTACVAGCAQTHAHPSSDRDPIGPGESSSDTVVAHTFFPEHRGAPGDPSKTLHVPDGFTVNVFASGLPGVRMLAVADDGTVYVTRPVAGEVLMLKPTGAGNAQAATAVSGMPGVHGIALRGRTV